MFNTILVALDSTAIAMSQVHDFEANKAEQTRIDISRHVFDEALSLGKSLEAKLLLMHIANKQELQQNSKFHGSETEFQQVCDKQLKELIDEASAKGVDIPAEKILCKIASEPIGQHICDMARIWNVDLIVMGRREHHRDLRHPLDTESVSSYVVHHAPCAVYVAHALAASNPNGAQPAAEPALHK